MIPPLQTNRMSKVWDGSGMCGWFPVEFVVLFAWVWVAIS